MSNQPVTLYCFGDEGVAVRSLRDLLEATGDLAPAASEGVAAGQDGQPPCDLSDVYDQELADAVRAFQQRRGLIVDGVVGPNTYISLDGARWTLGGRLLSYIPGHLL